MPNTVKVPVDNVSFLLTVTTFQAHLPQDTPQSASLSLGVSSKPFVTTGTSAVDSTLTWVVPFPHHCLKKKVAEGELTRSLKKANTIQMRQKSQQKEELAPWENRVTRTMRTWKFGISDPQRHRPQCCLGAFTSQVPTAPQTTLNCSPDFTTPQLGQTFLGHKHQYF